jgi:hypothetical protein
MDEVDSIILQNLRAIGTSIPDEVVRLKGLSCLGMHVRGLPRVHLSSDSSMSDAHADITAAMLVEGCARCINAIRGKDEVCSDMWPVRPTLTASISCKPIFPATTLPSSESALISPMRVRYDGDGLRLSCAHEYRKSAGNPKSDTAPSSTTTKLSRANC